MSGPKTIAFVVEGRPRPQPKPRTRGKGRFYPADYLDYRESATNAAGFAAAELEDRGDPWDPRRRAYSVRLRFFMPDKRRTDIDRLAATLLDALTRAGVLEDDRFVDKLSCERSLDPSDPRVEVEVRT